MKKVSVVSKTSDYECQCNWSEFILLNKEIFRKAAEDLWSYVPDDEEDLIYEWIKEIHTWIDGYVLELSRNVQSENTLNLG